MRLPEGMEAEGGLLVNPDPERPQPPPPQATVTYEQQLKDYNQRYLNYYNYYYYYYGKAPATQQQYGRW